MSVTPQNSVVRSTATCFGLFCLALILTSYSAKNPHVGQLGKYIVAEVVTPIQSLSYSMQTGVVGMWDGYVNLIEVRAQNTKLAERLGALENENSRLLEFEHENKRLRQLLSILEGAEFKGVAASVVGYNPSNWVKSITINRGESDGVSRGMAVIDAQGVVGQVISVARKSAEVLLITDHASGVDSIVQRTRARGVVEGSGGKLCRLRYVLKEEELKIGDRIITSGMDGVFPKGLLTGIISDLDRNKKGLFQLLEVSPTVDFAKLENVLVITSGNGVKS